MVTYTDGQMVDDLAQQLFVSLTADAPTTPSIDFSDTKYDFNPNLASDLYSDAKEISLEDLTQVDLTGNGVFDKLMAVVDLHIQREFKSNRITGDQYSKVYTEVMSGVLNSSVQFLLSKDQAHWTAITAQMQARIAEIEATRALIQLETAKVEAQKTIFDMKNSSAEYALNKLRLTNENQQNFLLLAQTDNEVYKGTYLLPNQLEQEQYKLDFLMPAQTGLIKEQWESQYAQTTNTRTDGVTAITGLIGKQKDSITADITAKQFNIDYVMPIQLDLVKEQREAERSKTLDTRTDGVTIVGSVGKQKDLYTQQIDSFIKDAKFKTAKMYLDGWITQKTLDEGLTAPSELTNTEINEVLVANRTANGL